MPSRLLCLLPAALTVLGLAACTHRFEPNAQFQAEYAGVCAACPPTRLDTLMRNVRGVVQVRVDAKRSLFVVDYDSNALNRQQIVSLLNESGYDVGDDIALLPSLVDPCCVRESGDLSLLIQPTDTVGLSAAQKQAFMDSLRGVLAGNPDGESVEAMLDAALLEAVPDTNLEAVLRQDILGGDPMTDQLLDELSLDPTTSDLLEDEELLGGLDQIAPAEAPPARRPQARPQPKRRN